MLGAELFVVEKILKKKLDRGVEKYRVKWHGYSDKQNTWEPACNLPPKLLEQFNAGLLDTTEDSDSSLSRKRLPEKPYLPRIKKILSLKQVSGEIFIKCITEGSKGSEYLRNDYVKTHFKDKLIAFYESKVRFK